ncbi:hypothetical protein [Pontibacter amylolyticus]|uniref:Uncharacterized protein n=1 Tax=Pontibacter amylolyticus TaxID=1424080 RepID=A0ABQ1W9C7_9BACT|nr:hypothetical protein [Pontibacter amylolyticus]GGG20764.1 hypothetical protein GCM10011323_25960 [Pontibacter amylolyticus]
MDTQDLKRDAQDLKNKADRINPQHKEGPVAAAIEDYTSRVPSDVFLWAALGSMAVSATLKIMKKDDEALFVGQWAPSFLLLGNYNKMIKLIGYQSDK